jgi:hypothetical protein
MNIFVLDNDPVLAAHYMCDKHVVKMILESAQMLSTVQHLSNNPHNLPLYKKCFVNHPCTQWVTESSENYKWLAQHAVSLCYFYSKRYDRNHKSEPLIAQMAQMLPNFINYKLTPFAQAMPDKYKVKGDAVRAYRAYYIGEKSKFAKWTCNPCPFWYTDAIKEKEYANTNFTSSQW